MSKWEMVRLGDICEYEQPNKYIVELDQYSNDFKIPVLTAGKSFVLGYTNETENIFHDVPVIIFDDFTTAIKYVDFPFKVKSSAMKILKVNNENNIKYIYYLMTTLKVDTTLHKRYWISSYSNIEISLPPLEEQKKIADELDKINNLIEKRKAQIEKLNLLVKAKFVEMFGDPVENPMEWEKNNLKHNAKITTGNTPPRSNVQNYGDFIEWIKTDNITSDLYLTKAIEYLSEKGLEKGRFVEENCILMACIAGSIKSIGRVAITNRKVSFNQQINAITPINYNVLFLYNLFKNTQEYIQSTINMSLKGILSKGKLEDLEFIIPPLPLQNQFADYVQKVEATKQTLEKSLTHLETLYKQRMQHYFD